MSPNLVVIVRSVIAFLSLLIYARILGKQQVSQLTFFDYVNGITIGSIAATLSTDLSSIAFHHWVGLTVWLVLTFIFQIISIRNRWLDKVLQGEPLIVIHNGKLLEDNLKKARYPYSDLMLGLRQKDVFDMAEVEFAVYESNGQLSVLKRSQFRPVTPKDLKIPTEYEGLSVELIMDGRVVEQNLKDLGLTRQWLMRELATQGVSDIKQVTFALLNTEGELYVDKKQDDIDNPTDPSDFPGPQ